MKINEIVSKEKHYAVELNSDPLNNDSVEYRKKQEKQTEHGVMTKDACEKQPKWDNEPKDADEQSPGFIGREKAKEKSGLPHKKTKDHSPDMYIIPASGIDLGNGICSPPI
jgi:hypothetical protein